MGAKEVMGAKEEFPARKYDISEPRVKAMMAAMYRRFFKDPATFVPQSICLFSSLIPPYFGLKMGLVK